MDIDIDIDIVYSTFFTENKQMQANKHLRLRLWRPQMVKTWLSYGATILKTKYLIKKRNTAYETQPAKYWHDDIDNLSMILNICIVEENNLNDIFWKYQKRNMITERGDQQYKRCLIV